MLDLWTPLGGDILEGGGAHHGEADQEHVRLGVGQRPQSEHNTHFSKYRYPYFLICFRFHGDVRMCKILRGVTDTAESNI